MDSAVRKLSGSEEMLLFVAVRDLFRARCDAKEMERRARQNLLNFLLRIGQVYSGGRNWSKMHWRWLESLSLPHAARQLALQEYIDTIKQCQDRLRRYDSDAAGSGAAMETLSGCAKVAILTRYSFFIRSRYRCETGWPTPF
ncbi:MAG: hypothetical protein LBR94_08130 [Desulfovibrio sp.]|nr:hypothetical protein [Desulfovibrio sp.]